MRGGRVARLVGPGLMTLLMLAVLIGLGTWQLRRLAWKESLLAEIARGEQGPAVPLAAVPRPFTRVRAEGRFQEALGALYGDEVRATPNGPQMGAQLIVPLARSDGDPVLVDRGWVPAERRRPIDQPAGEVVVEGYARPAERAGPLSAPDDPAARHFYSLDPAAIGAALGLSHVAPYILVALGPGTPGLYPDPAHQMPRPPNNHLSYAITWYGLAAALAAVYLLWARKVSRT